MILLSGLQLFQGEGVSRIVPSMTFGLSLKWIDQVSLQGARKNLRLVFLYHPIPEIGCLHLTFIALSARSLDSTTHVARPRSTISSRG
jgi:hypothetical protein